MKQENRFVAELYHYLAPFVDIERELLICVDGGAAKHHSESDEGILKDSVLPDLWFSFVGQKDQVGIEAKVMDGNTISVRQGQLQSWRTDGSGAYCPQFWVTTNRDLSEFRCWRHQSMIDRLNSTNNTTDNVKLSLANYPADHISDSVAQLALFVLRSAE